jgi:hypothetical protein
VPLLGGNLQWELMLDYHLGNYDIQCNSWHKNYPKKGDADKEWYSNYPPELKPGGSRGPGVIVIANDTDSGN